LVENDIIKMNLMDKIQLMPVSGNYEITVIYTAKSVEEGRQIVTPG
jgi:hypothetical protein